MSINFSHLDDQPRLLLEVPLRPIQGHRFQPTGFPDLGAATYTLNDDQHTQMLLVESAQSMANRLEAVCWDEASDDLVPALQGLPYVQSTLPDGTVTNSILEAHRLNSPYVFNSGEFKKKIEPEIGFEDNKPFDRRKLARALLKYDVGCLLHGVFLEKVGGTVRLPRSLSGFIEATKVEVAAYGGVKVDRVQPGTGENTPYGKAAEGYGSVPYHRDDYTGKITAYFNVDLAQIRGWGLGPQAEQLLITLALFKILKFLKVGLRLRTACDLTVCDGIHVAAPEGFKLPSLEEVEKALPGMIKAAASAFADPRVTKVKYQKKA
jgi:CRISPR-associated protein Csb1